MSGITKRGDPYLRKLLVQAARHNMSGLLSLDDLPQSDRDIFLEQIKELYDKLAGGKTIKSAEV